MGPKLSRSAALLTSDRDDDTNIKDDSRCLQRNMKETDDKNKCTQRHVKDTYHKNKCTGESTLNCSCRTCEVEVSCEGEADLHKYLNSCEKNPGHQNFVPVDQFSIDHLPSDYRNNDLLDLIRVMSDLTVRLSVKYVSDRRPKTWPGSNDPYPFCNDSHGPVMITGTGWVHEVNQFFRHSHCSKCKDSSSSSIKHCEICVRTAAHVVYDEQEAQHTTCHLFFDKGGTPDLCPGVVVLTGISSTQSDKKEDWCQIRYATCDLGLIDTLEKKLELYESLKLKTDRWLHDMLTERSRTTSYSVFCREKLLCVIVSHPHGCSKQVSVGYCKSRTPSNINYYYTSTKLTYTTPTCPGSSGAHILLPGNMSDDYFHVHSGNCNGNNELNHSSEGLDFYYLWGHRAKPHSEGLDLYYLYIYRALKSTTLNSACRLCLGDHVEAPTLLQQLPMSTERQGPRDVEVSYGGETELRQRYRTCKKYPWHWELIPVDLFNMDHLPSQFENPMWIDLIRTLSDLTVRVSVKSVSEKRPDDLNFLKTFSGGEQPDSCYTDSTRNMMLTGTGSVAKVIKYENSDEYRTCSCKECQMSQTPKTEFAQIYILTAIQVVYDNFEAEHSTCDFFFDRGHTPDTCPGAVTLSGVSVEDCKKTNLQYLICVTHDLCLADRLIEMINKYESLPKIIMDKIKSSGTGSYSPSEVASFIVVSHPHGCRKKVSVLDRSLDGETYITSTCSGSAGSHILLLASNCVSCYVHIGKCELYRDRGHGEWLARLAKL